MNRPHKNLAKPPAPLDPEEHAAHLGDKLSDAFWKTADTAYYVTRHLVKSTIQKISPPPPPKRKIFTDERIGLIVVLGPIALILFGLSITAFISAFDRNSDWRDGNLSFQFALVFLGGAIYSTHIIIKG